PRRVRGVRMPEHPWGRVGSGDCWDPFVIVRPWCRRVGPSHAEHDVVHLLLELRALVGEIPGLLGNPDHVVNFKWIGVGLNVVANTDVVALTDDLHLIANTTAAGGFELRVTRSFLAVEIFHVNAWCWLIALAGDRGHE